MKNFIYLVQGQSDLVIKYLHLRDREDADAIFLTYDKPLDGAIFFPNSTWAQGRNKLLECALAQGLYMYFIFCDDDAAFLRGDWDKFESCLLEFKPSIGVPIVPKTRKYRLRWLKCQYFPLNDEQLMAFHQDVVLDGLVLPYQEQFDDIHWWASCDIQEILIQNFYSKNILQFNTIEISNECQGRYEYVSGQDRFKKVVRDWLQTQVNSTYSDLLNDTFQSTAIANCVRKFIKFKPAVIINHTSIFMVNIASVWRTLIYLYSRRFFPSSLTHSVGEDKFRQMIRKDSKLFKQYKRITKSR